MTHRTSLLRRIENLKRRLPTPRQDDAEARRHYDAFVRLLERMDSQHCALVLADLGGALPDAPLAASRSLPDAELYPASLRLSSRDLVFWLISSEVFDLKPTRVARQDQASYSSLRLGNTRLSQG